MKKLLTLFLLSITLWAGAQINAYKANVSLDQNAALSVQETILFQNGTDPFSRVFDTYYIDSLGLQQDNNFKFISASAGGKDVALSAAASQRAKSAGVTFASSEEVNEFKINYSAASALRRFANADEIHFSPFDHPLYNVKKLSVTFTLPGAPNEIKVFSGTDGAKKEIEFNLTSAGNTYTVETENLNKNKIDIVLYMPKNIFVVAEAHNPKLLFSPQKRLAAASVLLGLILLYYIAAWLFLGVYDRKNIPSSDGKKVPQSLSAGEIRILYKKVPGQVGDRFKALSSAVLWLGAGGLITLEKRGAEYIISQTQKHPSTPEEKYLMKEIFKYTERFNSKEMAASDVKKLSLGFVKMLEEKLSSKYFTTNILWRAAGYAAVGAYMVWMYFYLFKQWPVTFFILCAAAIFISIFFASLFNPFNKKGRVVMRDIEAFRKFLMAGAQGKEITSADLKMFEQYLPYALALGVENKWCRRFASQLSADTLSWYKSDTLSAAPSLTSALSNEIGSGLTNSFYYTAE